MADADFTWDVEADRRALEVYPAAWRLVTALNVCLAKIAGKFRAYPSVDPSTFQRVHGALTRGLNRNKTAAELAGYCQELRAVANCPVAELLRPRGADDVDTRLTALSQVVQSHAALEQGLFEELLTALLSWEPPDKELILTAILQIIRA